MQKYLDRKEISKNNADRHVTWLELFYNLVFVVVISQLAHNLEEDFSLYGFLGFLALFIPVWWSCTGAAFYATRFDTDDLGHRILILLQMVGAAALAVNVPDGLGNNSAGFALLYAAIRIVLVLDMCELAKVNFFLLPPLLYEDTLGVSYVLQLYGLSQRLFLHHFGLFYGESG
jgi:low temperature requirement protein LtrA